MSATDGAVAAPPRSSLRRDLKLWQVIGLSVGLMAPSMAISINPQGAVGAVGRAIPLSFVIAMVGALFVAYGFARLSQHFNSAGSVLGLVGATLGGRAGVVAGWCLAGTYLLFSVLTAITAGIYGSILLADLGVVAGSPDWLAYAIAVATLVATGLPAAARASRATRVILSFEAATIGLIVVAAAVVLARLATRSGPHHLPLTLRVFTPAKGTTPSNVFLGVVFGFLSFGGFEAAATLGGEAIAPRRDIPRAVVGTVAVIGVFYVLISAVEVMGFGTSPGGLADFAASPALLGTLGRTYVAGWFGDLIIAGTIVSALGCSMASCVAASRLVFSFAHDALSRPSALGELHPQEATPVAGVRAVVIVSVASLGLLGLGIGATPLQVFSWVGEVATLLIMCAYGLVNAGALAHLFIRPLQSRLPIRLPVYEAAAPIVAIGVLGYTVYRNIVPYPTGDSAWLPLVAAAWLAVVIAFVFVWPEPSRRIGERMADRDGLPTAGSD